MFQGEETTLEGGMGYDRERKKRRRRGVKRGIREYMDSHRREDGKIAYGEPRLQARRSWQEKNRRL